MSNYIRLTPELEAECRKKFDEEISKASLNNGKFNFSKTFESDETALVYFTSDAWYKMTLLVQEFPKEVAWHGVVERADDEEDANKYIVSDILVYPQTVSGSYIDMDPDAYAKWLCDNIEDDRFFNLYMQGHSHVDMGVTPSGTDLEHQKIILSQLKPDGFYIFMILNKSSDCHVTVYDLKKNLVFSDGDVLLEVESQADYNEFLENARAQVKEKPVYKAIKKSDTHVKSKTDSFSSKMGAGWAGADRYDDDYEFENDWRVGGCWDRYYN